MDSQTISREHLEEHLVRKAGMAMFMPEAEKRIFAPKVQGALQRREKSVSCGVIDQEPICSTLNPFEALHKNSGIGLMQVVQCRVPEGKF